MTRRNVTDGSRQYVIADEDPLAGDISPWAVVRTSVIDELTLAAPRTPLRITTNVPHATTRVANGGLCGLVARPRDVAAALTTPGELQAEVDAPGFLPRDLTPAIDTARRTLVAAALSGTSSLSVAPPDTVPATQFRPGRGVMLERMLPADAEEFTTQPLTGAPPPPATVPLTDPVGVTRFAGAQVAGVPIVLPDQPLHRSGAVRVQGRALRRVSPPDQLIPAPAAQIGILGVWRTYPATVNQAPFVPDVCAVEPGLRFAHPVGAVIETCTLITVGAPREARELVSPGMTELFVAPNNLLNPAGGDVLQVGDVLTGEADVVVTESFTPATDPNLPVRVRLTAPVAYLHRPGAVVRNLAVAALAAVGTVDRESLPGDEVLFSAGTTAWPTNTLVAVDRGTLRVAFYRAQQLPFTPNSIAFSHQVVVNADGRFDLPPIARVAQLRIAATHAGHPPLQIDFALDYGGDNTLTIVFN